MLLSFEWKSRAKPAISDELSPACSSIQQDSHLVIDFETREHSCYCEAAQALVRCNDVYDTQDVENSLTTSPGALSSQHVCTSKLESGCLLTARTHDAHHERE